MITTGTYNEETLKVADEGSKPLHLPESKFNEHSAKFKASRPKANIAKQKK